MPGQAWLEVPARWQAAGRRRRSSRGWRVVRLGRCLGLLPLADARGDGLCDRGRGAWGSPLWGGVQGMGGLEGFDALDELAHGRLRRLGTLLGGAGQRGLQLVAEVRQGLQIRRMGKPGAQPGFIIPRWPWAMARSRRPCRAPSPRCR